MEGHLLEGELVDLLLSQAGEDPQAPLLQQLGPQKLADCPTLAQIFRIIRICRIFIRTLRLFGNKDLENLWMSSPEHLVGQQTSESNKLL